MSRGDVNVFGVLRRCSLYIIIFFWPISTKPVGYYYYYYYYYFYLLFLVPSVVKIPRVKNIKLKSDLEWLTFGVIAIDEGASESNLIETLY